ncbi:alpha/beta hydrolase [Rubellimicrobium aerolatum]|uniref:Alpha/beta hydrolase n=1 Tax=Rubellimicrobium aerolatum TaxID=490979 RepID=A0ABW0SFJ6_9RHOB|nr:dienelactone hydrolase family protein [Rubellimicrobium aerolatum]MBP1807277.1 phospholipase/carboxylesterase [Rubellimicrobium aerolatum]
MDAGPLVVLLHGVGARGRDLEPLARAIARGLPGARTACPDAPEPCDWDAGTRQWFSLTAVAEEERPARVRAARAGLDRAIGGIVAAEGMSGSLGRVALVGFSQGGTMALDAVASGRWPVAALAAIAGRWSIPAPMRPPGGTRVLLLHGEADPVVPVADAGRAAAALEGAGLAVRVATYPGVGHAIPPRGVAAVVRFLAEALAGEAGTDTAPRPVPGPGSGPGPGGWA